MIVTVTLNAAVDKLYRVDVFEAGIVTRVRECRVTAGGKGLNVSRVAALLGEKVTATGFLGGHTGQYVEEMLQRDGIRSDFVHVQGESRTCINIIDAAGKSTELLEPGVSVSEKDKERFLDTFRRLVGDCSAVVLSGSVPPGCGPEFYPRLIRIAKESGRPVLLDTSGENLKRGVKACPTLVKPNRDEIRALLGMDSAGREQAVGAALNLHRSGIPYAVISMGKYGAILACGEGVFEGTPPDVPVVNTVGCGDSMIAAFAVAMHRRYPAEHALRFALEVSSANAMCSRTGFFHTEDLQKILGTGIVRRLA